MHEDASTENTRAHKKAPLGLGPKFPHFRKQDVTDECLACAACIDECPEEAISEGDPIYIIDPELCTDCGTCVDSCPNDAIVAD